MSSGNPCATNPPMKPTRSAWADRVRTLRSRALPNCLNHRREGDEVTDMHGSSRRCLNASMDSTPGPSFQAAVSKSPCPLLWRSLTADVIDPQWWLSEAAAAIGFVHGHRAFSTYRRQRELLAAATAGSY